MINEEQVNETIETEQTEAQQAQPEEQAQAKANTASINLRGVDYTFEYTVEDVDKFTKNYCIKVFGDLYKALEKETYFKTKGKYNIPGFRKGKATMASIKNHYGQNAFFEDTIDEAIDALYRAIYRTVLLPAGMAASPSVGMKSVDAEGFEFYYVITIMSDPENLVYKDLEYTVISDGKYINDIAEAKLQKDIEKAGYWQDITDRPLQDKDTANINYVGTLNGEPFEGGSADKYDLVIGSGSFIPGFEEKLIGMTIGETRDIDLTFPEDYHHEPLAGKDVVFNVKLNSIKVKVLPEVNDEFAADVSEFDTIDELKADYKAQAEKESAARAKSETEANLIDAVLKANESYEIAPKVLDELAEDRYKDFEERLSTAGLNPDMYFMYAGTTKEEIIKNYRKEAEASEKRNAILSAILKAEDIKLDPEEVDAKVAELAEKAQKSVEDYKKEIQSSEWDTIYNNILSEKLIARLKEINVPKSE